MPFATVEEAAELFRRGEFVIIVDDEDRENEGDLAIAAEKITPAAIRSATVSPGNSSPSGRRNTSSEPHRARWPDG